MKILCDNQSVIRLSKNQQFHNRTKHIDIKFHYIQEQIEKGMIEIVKVHTTENVADMLTKPVVQAKFEHCLRLTSIQVLENG